jgi:hypothetical protein
MGPDRSTQREKGPAQEDAGPKVHVQRCNYYPGAAGMSRPLALSDDELAQVMAACRSLPVRDRDAFLQGVAEALRSCDEIGPGAVHRAIVTVQRRHFDPPDLSRSTGLTAHSVGSVGLMSAYYSGAAVLRTLRRVCCVPTGA